MSDDFDRGIQTCLKELDALSRNGVAVARAAVSAGVGVLVGAAKSASPGGIKDEIGGYVRVFGGDVIGKAGLMEFPSRDGQKIRGRQPHGLFIDGGTRYIVARHMIRNALRSAQPRAAAAMERAANRKIEKLKGKS